MTPDISKTGRENVLGSLWMITSMAAFAVEDALIKTIATVLPISQILIFFGLGGALIFACVAILNKQPLFPKAILSRPMRVRVIFEITGRLFYVLAISLTPLSSATVILQATPLVVVAGATFIFGETVGWRRWLSIIIGLVGVIIIIQPGADSFSMLSILAVIGMIGFAGRDLASRAAPESLGTPVLGFHGFVSIIIAGAAFAAWEQRAFVWPEGQLSIVLVASVFAGVAAYACLMKAMRTGQISAVTPFRYTRLLFGITLGVLVFGERLSFEMVLGSGLIVLSGLFIAWRGTMTKTQTD